MSTEMHLENGKLILGRKECSECYGKGTTVVRVPCPVCHGTGKGKRGGERGCKKCYGMAQVNHPTALQTCPQCRNINPTTAEQGTRYDYMPTELWQSLPFKVYRSNRGMSLNESLLALNCVFSCSDYGAATKKTDEEVIADVKSNTTHQACKVAKDDSTICDHVGIFVNTGGYSVRAVFGTPATVEDTIQRELPYEKGLRLGKKLAEQGLNGTVLACLPVKKPF